MSYRCFVPFWGVDKIATPGLRGVGNILAALRQLLGCDVNQSTLRRWNHDHDVIYIIKTVFDMYDMYNLYIFMILLVFVKVF